MLIEFYNTISRSNRFNVGKVTTSQQNMQINKKNLPSLFIFVFVSSPKNVTQGASSFEIHETFCLKDDTSYT